MSEQSGSMYPSPGKEDPPHVQPGPESAGQLLADYFDAVDVVVGSTTGATIEGVYRRILEQSGYSSYYSRK